MPAITYAEARKHPGRDGAFAPSRTFDLAAAVGISPVRHERCGRRAGSLPRL